MKMPEMPQSRRRTSRPLKTENKIQKDKNEKKERQRKRARKIGTKKNDNILFNKEEARITYNIKYRMIKASVYYL